MKPLVAHLVRIPKDENLPLQHWAIDGLPRLNGKRQRKFFRTKDAAERALASVKVKLRKEGEKALLITDTLRIEAVGTGLCPNSSRTGKRGTAAIGRDACQSESMATA
jgi:hypothetical protein